MKYPANIQIVLYHATWCPHCVKFMPVWHKLEELINKNKIVIECVKVITKEASATVEDKFINEMSVDGYPTIKIILNKNDKKNKTVHEYNGKRDISSILYGLLDVIEKI